MDLMTIGGIITIFCIIISFSYWLEECLNDLKNNINPKKHIIIVCLWLPFVIGAYLLMLFIINSLNDNITLIGKSMILIFFIFQLIGCTQLLHIIKH